MKIGILTFHDGINHGAYLQVYCLQQYLLSQGYQNQIINYRSFDHYMKEYSIFLGTRLLRNRKQWHFWFKNLIKVVKFRNSHRSFYLTRYVSKVEKIAEREHFDTLILGSDEIWNYKNPLAGFDLAYFGHGINATKKISYAPSFGMITPAEGVPQSAKTALGELSAISVRDNNSLEIIRSLSLSATKVLDPTFLYTVPVTQPKINIADYVLIYAGSMSEAEKQLVQRFAAEKGLIIVSVGYYKPWADVDFMSAGISEWLELFSKANCIFTNTFHGTIYSILNRKPFWVLNPGSKTNKIIGLLEDLNLESRILPKGNEEATSRNIIEAATIDYGAIYTRLDELRQISFGFIHDSL